MILDLGYVSQSHAITQSTTSLTIESKSNNPHFNTKFNYYSKLNIKFKYKPFNLNLTTINMKSYNINFSWY